MGGEGYTLPPQMMLLDPRPSDHAYLLSASKPKTTPESLHPFFQPKIGDPLSSLLLTHHPTPSRGDGGLSQAPRSRIAPFIGLTSPSPEFCILWQALALLIAPLTLLVPAALAPAGSLHFSHKAAIIPSAPNFALRRRARLDFGWQAAWELTAVPCGGVSR